MRWGEKRVARLGKPQPGNERRSNLYLNTRIFQDAARFIFHLVDGTRRVLMIQFQEAGREEASPRSASPCDICAAAAFISIN